MDNEEYAKFHRGLMRTIVVAAAITAVFMGGMIVFVVYAIGCKVLGL